MAESKKIDLSMNLNLLPPEMVEKILKLLNFNDICQAQLICRRWNEIIKKGNLVQNAASKITDSNYILVESN